MLDKRITYSIWLICLVTQPKVTSLATTQLDIFQIVPAKTVGTGSQPDFAYALDFPENTEVTGDGQTFTIQDNIDFTVSSSQDPTLITVAQVNGATTQLITY